MRPLPDRRRPLAPHLAAALLALGGLACSDGPLSGPGLPAGGVSLRLEPRIEPRANVVAAGITKVRIAIARVPDRLVVLDSVVDLLGSSGAELDLAVPLASSADRFVVRLAAADAAGDTIFRAADTTAVVRGTVVRSLELMLRYAGRDTGVVRIVAGPDTVVADAGASVPLWAVGYRPGAEDPAPLAHVAWRSEDETVVRVSRTGGLATAIAPGRSAWIYATTVTGLVDSARVVVRHALASLEASPASLALTAGATAAVVVTGRAPDGAAADVDAAAWSSSDSTVAIVDASGAVTAVGVGSATITAASGGARVAIPVVVQRAEVAHVHVAPATVSLLRTSRAQLAATVTLETGAVAAHRPVVWTSSDGTVATVDAGGVVHALGVGSATVTAAAGGRSATVAVAVAALPADAIVASPATVQLGVGQPFMLAATVTDPTGEPLPNTVVTWTSADPGVATVSSAGTIAALAPGTTTVTASANGRASTVAVTVLPVPVAEVRLSSTSLALLVGQAAVLSAAPRAADGTALTGLAVSWSSSKPAVATVDASGRVVAVGVGSASIVATSGGVTAMTRVDVAPIPVAHVQLSAAVVSLQVGATFQLRADAYDSLGRLLPGRTVTWASTNASVASVATDGLVTAKAAGQTAVSATIGGKSAAATVTVQAPSPPTLQFTPSGAKYAVGQMMRAQFVRISRDVGPATIQLSTNNSALAMIQPTATVAGTTPAPFAVIGRAVGTMRLQATTPLAATGTSDVTVVLATLRPVGFAGTTVRKDAWVRLHLVAGGADGTAADAVFAEATPFTLTYAGDSIEVHRDKFPDSTTGPADGSHKDGKFSPGDTIQPTIGARHISLIIRARTVGEGTLTVTSPGRYVRLEARGLTVVP